MAGHEQTQQADRPTPVAEALRGRAPLAGPAIVVAYEPGTSDTLRGDLLRALGDGAREIVLVVRPSATIASHDLELVEAVGATLADRGGALLTLTGDALDTEAFLVRELRGAKNSAPARVPG